ncbi:MAG: hypothetical protein WBE40_07845 [Thermoplasmata archaeon]
MEDPVASVNPEPDSYPPPPARPAGGARSWLVSAWRGEQVPERPLPPPETSASRAYLALGLLLVVVSVVIVELAYGMAPVPPGVDSGDWVQRSFAWVGLAHPPVDAVGSPFLYNPGIFPLLGVAVLLTGSPLTADFVFGGALLFAFGLTTVHVARRYLVHGTFQLLFVGLMVLNGTTLSILFWGGYPNFLAFVLFNEALVLLLLFLRTRTLRDGLLFYGVASLIYLTHDLTFAVFAATVVVSAFLFVLTDRRWWGTIVSKANVAGLIVLGVTVVAYEQLTKYLRIQVPGYIASNPAAYLIDNIGEIFRPLNSGPMLVPAAAGVTMGPWIAVAVLVTAGLGVLALLATAARWRPHRVDLRHYIAAASLLAACGVPVAGYVVHVDTDYTRFVYFLTFPVLLLLCLSLEGVLAPRLRPAPAPGMAPPAPANGRSRRRTISREAYALVAVLVVLVLFVTNVTVPAVLSNERTEIGSDHDSYFLEATQWLNANGRSGSILTTQGAVRWSEALTDRGAFDIGPTWLLFESWQIVNAEETYLALNSLTAVSNNVQALSYSGFNTTALPQAPMYSAFIEGVPFPLLDVVPESIYANGSSGGNYTETPAYLGPYAAQLAVPGPAGNSALLTYSTPRFDVAELGTTAAGGATWVNVTVTPVHGANVSQFNLTLAGPPTGDSFLHAPSATGDWWTGGALEWNDSGVLGQLPGNYAIRSWVTPTPAPEGTPNITSGEPNNAEMTFDNPHPGQPFSVSFEITTDDASNPAIVLPSVLNTSTFLAQHNIHFLLLPNQAGFVSTATFYEAVFQFSVKYQNAEWTILEG